MDGKISNKLKDLSLCLILAFSTTSCLAQDNETETSKPKLNNAPSYTNLEDFLNKTRASGTDATKEASALDQCITIKGENSSTKIISCPFTPLPTKR